MASENIFQQYLRPVKSVAEYTAELDDADSRQQLRQQNALQLAAGQQKQDDYMRERAGENALSRLYGSGKTPDQIGADLARQGYVKQAMAYTKQQQEAANAKATGEHLGAQTGKLTAESGEIARKQREEKRQKAITDIAAFTDPQQAAASLKLHIDAGDVDPQQGALIMQTIPQNPADFPKWQVGMLQRIMAADKAAGQILPDANNVATNARSAADAAAGREVTKRGQNMTDARQREVNQAPKGQVIQTDDGPMLVDPRSGNAQPVMANGQPVQPKLKPLPAPIQKALLENGSSLRKVEDALAAIEKYPDALGAANYLGDGIRQRTDPEGITARALVADIGSLKIHDRSGAAVTASETPRLKPFIPSATDNPETVKKKLSLFRQEYEAIQSDITGTYSREQGYRASPAPPPKAPPKANVPNANAKGWTLHTDAKGNRAYVSPDGKNFEEVR